MSNPDLAPGALQKPEPRAISKAKSRAEKKEALEQCYADVDLRDGGFCAVTGRYTVSGSPDRRNRREHHHLRGRNVAPEAVDDPANVITVTAEAHSLIESGHLIVEGDDARKPIKFHWADSTPASSRIFRIKSKRWSANE